MEAEGFTEEAFITTITVDSGTTTITTGHTAAMATGTAGGAGGLTGTALTTGADGDGASSGAVSPSPSS